MAARSEGAPAGEAAGTIVVGVDGTASSLRALSWALAEGRVRRAPVRVVLAWEFASAASPEAWAPGDEASSELVRLDADQQQLHAEHVLAELVGSEARDAAVECVAVLGSPADVLVEQSRHAALLVVGSRGRGGIASALLGSVSQACARRAACPVVVIGGGDGAGGNGAGKADRQGLTLARQHAQNRRSWEALERLGVQPGSELALDFLFESGGVDADRELAEFLRAEYGYEAECEPGGVIGRTMALAVDPEALDAWVDTMVRAGQAHGGCAFDGWSATLPAHHGG